MDYLNTLRIACTLWGTAMLVGCHPFQGGETNPLFGPPQPIPMGDVVATATPNGGLVGQPQFVAPGRGQANYLYVPVSNQDWTWEQIVDVVDDYFRIERENRVQLVGNIMTEGRIDTFPQVGATWLEPHRPDSVGWDNRWESTFQTIRRRGVLRIIPEQGGYLLDVAVYKELEDLPRPESSMAGAATFRNDNSLRSRLGEEVSRTRFAANWIPQGRDPFAEQQILADIQARLGP